MAVKNFGIDISWANNITDYNALINSNYSGSKIKYALIRVGYMGRIDALFKKHYANLHGKLPLGAYFYSYARSAEEAKKEAEWLIGIIKDYEFEFPIVFDYEDKYCLSPKLSEDTYTAVCKAFLDTVQAAGYYAMMYCNPDLLENYLHKEEILKYPLWLAHYTTDGKQRQYGQKMWQFGTFTPSGVAKNPDGSAGMIDANYCYEQLAKHIRDNGLNKPKPPQKYKIIATKTVVGAEVPDEVKEIRDNGYMVIVEKCT